MAALIVATSVAHAAGPRADRHRQPERRRQRPLGLNYSLENGAPASLLGGVVQAPAWAGGNTFLALPDRGPNASAWNSAVDDTTSFIARFTP